MEQGSLDLPRFRQSRPGLAQVLFKLWRGGSRDLAFIAAGLGILLLAPAVAFFSSSGIDTARMQPGFDQKAFLGMEAGSPFEDGVRGVAPGSLIGRDAEIITPLVVSHPLDLISIPDFGDEPLLPEPKAEPPAKKPAGGGWREAVNAAKHGMTTAAKKSGLPKPSVKLASRLSGISSFAGGSGGSGGSVSLAPPSSKGLLPKPAVDNHLSRVMPASDYRGMDLRSGAAGTGGKAGSYLDPKRMISNGGTGALQGNDPLPAGPGASGGGASGGTGQGRSDPADPNVKLAGVSSTQDKREIQKKEKEDLKLMAKKMNMQQAIQLKWDKRRYNEIERKKMKEQIAMQTASQALLKILEKGLDAMVNAAKGGQDGGAQGQGGGKGMNAAEGVGRDMDDMLGQQQKTSQANQKKKQGLKKKEQELKEKEERERMGTL